MYSEYSAPSVQLIQVRAFTTAAGEAIAVVHLFIFWSSYIVWILKMIPSLTDLDILEL